jgi:hypothetical protein
LDKKYIRFVQGGAGRRAQGAGKEKAEKIFISS